DAVAVLGGDSSLNQSNTCLTGGWWVAGPFIWPEEEPTRRPDPHEPLPPARDDPDRLPRRWLPAETTSDGCVDLEGSLRAGQPGCAYALLPLWSPVAQTVNALFDASGPCRLWLDGRLIHHTSKASLAAGGAPIRLALPAGWCTLLVRLEAGAAP